jgi:hypothetical protein
MAFNGDILTGKIETINQFCIEIKDKLTEKIIPCDFRQVELTKRLINGVEIALINGLAWVNGKSYDLIPKPS